MLALPILSTLLSFLGGALVAYLNYRVNLRALRKKPNSLGQLSVVREILSVVYFVAVYYLSARVPGGRVAMLVAAAVGLTVPSVLLSLKLSKIAEEMAQQANDLSEEGEDMNG